jgi:phosphomannomutase
LLSITSTHLSVSGFKYIGNVALQLDKEGYKVPFAYEEAIGYMVETNIRDKDGVSATVRVDMFLPLPVEPVYDLS